MPKKIKENLLLNRELLKYEIKNLKQKWGQSIVAWIGWCKECKAFRVHIVPTGISYNYPTCSLGHKSEGHTLEQLLKYSKTG